MTKKKKLLIFGGGGVLVVAMIVANFVLDSKNELEIQATEVRARTLVEKVSASGRIQPQTKVDIVSEINGEIVDILIKEGDHVETGQLLAILDTIQLRTDVDQARFAVSEIKARLNGARISLEEAEEEFQRQERLFKDDLTSETQFSNSRYRFRGAQATVEATIAQASQFESRYEKQLDYLSKAKIAAPMTGVITFVDCEIGEIAAAQTSFTQGRTLMTISDLSVFEVEVEVDETEIAKVRVGQSTEIEVDAIPDTVFVGRVDEIGNTAILTGVGTQDQSTNFRVKIIFAERHPDIRPGLSADVDITTNERDGILSIPFASVVMRTFDPDSLEEARNRKDLGEDVASDDLQAAEAEDIEELSRDDDVEREDMKGVFVIKDGEVAFRQIETGIADAKNIEVTSGLQAGDSLVTGPYRILRTIKDGDLVKPRKKPAKEKD